MPLGNRQRQRWKPKNGTESPELIIQDTSSHDHGIDSVQ